MRVRYGLIGALTLAGGGLAGWELQRRRDRRAVRADPLWSELNAPLQGRPVRVRSSDGTELHVEIHGGDTAPPVVLLHGWLESVDLWKVVIRELAATHRVIVYDQRGHGRSAIPEGLTPYTEERLADDLQAVLSTCVEDGERCVVAGHSMGGMTIVAWAGLHPDAVTERCAGAVLVNTATHDLVPENLILGPLAGARIHAAVMPRALSLYRPITAGLEPIAYRIVRRIAGGSDTSPAQVAFYHRMFLATPAPVATGFGRMFSTLDLRESIPALTVPAVVIAGADDVLLPPAHSRRLAEVLPDSAGYIELDRVGHMAPVEAAPVIVDAIRRLTPAAPSTRARRQPSRRPRRARAEATAS